MSLLPSLFGEKVLGIKKFPLLQNTFIVILSSALQPPALVTKALYTIVFDGVDEGSWQVLQLKPVVGNHCQFVTSPELFVSIVTLVPTEIVMLSSIISNTGIG
jgi:hypothetical protein